MDFQDEKQGEAVMPVIMEKKTDHCVAIFARASIEVRPEAIKKKAGVPNSFELHKCDAEALIRAANLALAKTTYELVETCTYAPTPTFTFEFEEWPTQDKVNTIVQILLEAMAPVVKQRYGFLQEED